MLVKKLKDNTFEFYEEITAVRTTILNVVQLPDETEEDLKRRVINMVKNNDYYDYISSSLFGDVEIVPKTKRTLYSTTDNKHELIYMESHE